MNKFEMFQQCGVLVGLKFKAAPDSNTPNMEFEIIEEGLKDPDGFPAVKLQYADGETEIAAVDILSNGAKNQGLIII